MDLVDLYLAYVEPLKGSPAYHRWSILSVIAALLERRVWLDRGRLGILFPNTYSILVGPPAAGKSTAAGIAVDLLAQIRPNGRKPPHIGPTKITQAALYKELKDAERVTQIAGNGSMRTSPLFLYASELAINMSDFGGGTLTNELIDFYDSKGLDVTILKRTVKEDTLKLWNPSVTLLGCTTDSFLQGAAQEKLITSGLASRILFVVETDRVAKQRKQITPDATAYRALIAKLNEIYKLQGPMTFLPDAYEAFITIADTADDACFTSKSEFHQNYYGRKPDHVTKVAMLFAACRGKNKVCLHDVEKAVSWIEELEPTMIKAFGVRSIEFDEDLSEQILSAVPEHPQIIHKSVLFNNMREAGKFVPDSRITEATVRALVYMKQIEIQHIGSAEYYTRPLPPKAS